MWTLKFLLSFFINFNCLYKRLFVCCKFTSFSWISTLFKGKFWEFNNKSNEKNKNLSASDIADLDKKWQEAEGIDDFIKPYITNDCALYLVSFQDSNDVFSEIFITDVKGLIIWETNKTSDFYQADEDWWVQTYNNGTGNEFYGKIEYDESSRSEAIPVYVPVFDPETNVVIGVIKAVCDITAIKLEL